MPSRNPDSFRRELDEQNDRTHSQPLTVASHKPPPGAGATNDENDKEVSFALHETFFSHPSKIVNIIKWLHVFLYK
jgi:hypothetical protein